MFVDGEGLSANKIEKGQNARQGQLEEKRKEEEEEIRTMKALPKFTEKTKGGKCFSTLLSVFQLLGANNILAGYLMLLLICSLRSYNHHSAI